MGTTLFLPVGFLCRMGRLHCNGTQNRIPRGWASHSARKRARHVPSASAPMHTKPALLRWLRYAWIVLPPLLLLILEIRHPVPAGADTPWQTIVASNGWWLQLHIIQLFLFCALGISVICLIATSISVATALPLLCSIGVFLAFYSVLDAITGIASGLVVNYASVLSDPIQLFGNQLIVVFLAHPVIGGGTLSATGLLGGGGWLVSMLLLARLARKEYQIHPLVIGLLIASGLFFGLSHLPPTGPLGMLCYLIASLAILHRQQKTSSP